MNKNSGRTRQRIIQAAAEIFSERGFRATTVRAICTRANANVAAINYHFGSKQKLYIEVHKHVFQGAASLLQSRTPIRVANAGEWRREMHRWVYALLDQVTNPKQLHVWQCRLFSRERCEPSQALPLLLKDFFLPIRDRLIELLRMALPEDVAGNVLQCWSINLIAQCTVYAQRRSPWDQYLLPANMVREQWLATMADHITESAICRLEFRSGDVKQGQAPSPAPPA